MPGSPARMRKGPRVSGPLPAPNPSSSLEFRPDRQELLADYASVGRPAGAACVGGGTGVGGRSVHAETCSGGAGLRGKSSAKQERRVRGWGQLAVSVPRCLGAHCRVGAQTWPQRPPAGAPCHLCEPRSRREKPFAGPSEGGGSSPAARVCRAPRRLPGRPLAPPTSKTASTWGRDEGDQGEGTGAIRAQRAGSGRRGRALCSHNPTPHAPVQQPARREQPLSPAHPPARPCDTGAHGEAPRGAPGDENESASARRCSLETLGAACSAHLRDGASF